MSRERDEDWPVIPDDKHRPMTPVTVDAAWEDAGPDGIRLLPVDVVGTLVDRLAARAGLTAYPGDGVATMRQYGPDPQLWPGWLAAAVKLAAESVGLALHLAEGKDDDGH